MKNAASIIPHFFTLVHVPFPFLRVARSGHFFRLSTKWKWNECFLMKSGRIGKIKDQMITDCENKWNKYSFHKEFLCMGSPVTDYHDVLGFIVSLGLQPLKWLKPRVYKNEAQKRFLNWRAWSLRCAPAEGFGQAGEQDCHPAVQTQGAADW